MRARRLIRQAHRWLGLLVGLQVLLWVVGGLTMSALRLEEVRGDDRAADHAPVNLDPGAALVAPRDVLAQHGPATELALTTLLSRPVYRLKAGENRVLVDASSGEKLSPIPRELAERIARHDYKGEAAAVAIDWVDQPGLEYRGRPLPLWRVTFADDRNSTTYVSPASGEIVARRNDLWRTFDFVWMLHIMDYQDREDFNHPLLVATAATALLFVLTGAAMLFYSFKGRSPRG